MLANFLIGLREGLEASLVVGILVAAVVRMGQRDKLPAIWWGTASAVAVSLTAGALLTFTSRSLSFRAQEAFGGLLSLVAVAFVTGMIFWMRGQARHLKGELQGQVTDAIRAGGLALAVVAFLAVGREGLETALFIWSAAQAAGSGAAPVVGAAVGLTAASVLGWLVYRRSIALDLSVFFRVTGAALIVVVAGIAAYGVHDLQEAAILPGLHRLAFDVSAHIPPSSWYGTVLKGVFNFSPASTWLEVGVYVAYLVPVMYLFFRSPAAAPPAPVASQEVASR